MDQGNDEVIRLKRPESWKEIFRALDDADIPEDFLVERGQGMSQERRWL